MKSHIKEQRQTIDGNWKFFYFSNQHKSQNSDHTDVLIKYEFNINMRKNSFWLTDSSVVIIR